MNDINQNSPYSAPQADLLAQGAGTGVRRYAGFWIRFLASIIDSIILLILTWPLLYYIYGADMFSGTEMVKGVADILLSYVFPLVFSVVLWMKYGGTPGKRMLGLRLINEETGENLDVGKSIVRYIGYIISALVLLLGFIWVAFDKKKKGWHDHMAGSVVIVE